MYLPNGPVAPAAWSLRYRTSNLGGRGRKKPLAQRSRRPRPALELLEDRTLLSVSITGTVYDDVNGSKVRDAGEKGVAGATVYLDLNKNAMLDQVFASLAGPTALRTGTANPIAGTAASVPLTVAGLPDRVKDLNVRLTASKAAGSGSISIALLSPTGLVVTGGPIGPDLVTLAAGASFNATLDDEATRAVRLSTSPYTGSYVPLQAFFTPDRYVYNGNPNGDWVLIFYSGSVTGLTLTSWSLDFTYDEPAATTDAVGNYAFSNLAAGNYQVGVLTAPAGPDPSRAVTVVPGQAAAGQDLGVRPAADLLATHFAVTAPPASWGQPATVSYTLTNQGPGDAGAFQVEVRLSADGTIDGSDQLLTTIDVGSLAAGATITGTVTVLLPGSPGVPPAGFGALDQAFLGLRVDPAGAVPEQNTANNSNRGAGKDLAAVAVLGNVAAAAGAGVQQQPSLAVNPTDSNHLVMAYQDSSLVTGGFAGVGVAVSHDGGATWTRSSIPLPLGFDEAAGYPSVRFDAQGRVYLGFMAVKFLGQKPPLIFPEGRDSTSTLYRSYGMQANNGIFVARSTDGGTTWGGAVPVVSNTYTPGGSPVPYETLPDLAVDMTPTSPFFGRVYVTWTRYWPAGQFPNPAGAVNGGSDVYLAVSTDQGANWATKTKAQGTSSAVSVLRLGTMTDASDPPGGGKVNFSHIAIGPTGVVYVSFFDGGVFRVVATTNSGTSISLSLLPFGGSNATFPNTVLPGGQFRTFPVRAIAADPTRAGVLYALEAVQINNSNFSPSQIDAAEIQFSRSVDNGSTWQRVFSMPGVVGNLNDLTLVQQASYRAALNDDNGGRFLQFATSLQGEAIGGQALPKMAVDAQGNIAVIWYDTRRDPAGKKLDVYGTVSTDGGRTFSANFRLSDATFDPKDGGFTDPLGGTNYFLGDGLGLATTGGRVFAAWTDTRQGSQDVYFTRQALTPPAAALGDRLEPNNAAGPATDLGTVSSPVALPRLDVAPGDEDWFRLTAGADGSLQVSATAAGAAGDLQLELYDATGQTLLAAGGEVRDAGGQVVGREVLLASGAGTVYLARVLAPTGSRVNYTLSARALTEDLGTRVYAQRTGTAAAGAQLLYRVTSAVAGSLEAALAATGAGLTVRVLSADGQTVLGQASVAAGGVGGASVAVAAGQAVLVQVSATGNTGPAGFTLDVTNLDAYLTQQRSSLTFSAYGAPTAVALADTNGDGKLDAVASTTAYDNPVSVLLGSGDGTLGSPRGVAVGPGITSGSAVGFRGLVVTDLTGDGVPDLAATNFVAGTVSVLAGRGDGTFGAVRVSDAVVRGEALAAGDFDGDGHKDLVVLQRVPDAGEASQLALLLGRGDGTYRPPVLVPTTLTRGAGSVIVGDFNGDSKDDVLAFGYNESVFNFLAGNGDGTFAAAATVTAGENVTAAVAADAQGQPLDFNGDGHRDLVLGGSASGNVYLLYGHGDGTFGAAQPFFANTDAARTAASVTALVVVDAGGASGFGSAADGKLDLAAVVVPRVGAGSPQVVFLAGQTGTGGAFTGFGAAQRVAAGPFMGPLAAGDTNGDGRVDLAAPVPGGVRVLYGQPPAVASNDTPATARSLGTVAHVVTQTQVIVPGHEASYFTLTVPTETAGAVANVLDFAAMFQYQEGGGLGLEVFDSGGHRVGSGTRFQVIAGQGDRLTVKVSGAGAAGAAGTAAAGAYTLSVSVLPQLVAVEAPSLLPGPGGTEAGPVTKLILSFQGNRLDRASAEDVGMYSVRWLGPDGAAGTADDRVLTPAQAKYNPGANVVASSGRSFPTALRQTVSLLFDEVLPAGSYQVEVGPDMRTVWFSDAEPALMTGGMLPAWHPVMHVASGQALLGGKMTVLDMVQPPSGTVDLSALTGGTRFLTHLQNDLGAQLDWLLTQKGDDPSLTPAILEQIRERLAPLYTVGGVTVPFLVLFLDPVSIDVADTQGARATYNLQNGRVANAMPNTFVEVGGSVEMVVVGGAAGAYQLKVSDVPGTARGGAVVMSSSGSQVISITDALRGGETNFTFEVPGGDEGSGGGDDGGDSGSSGSSGSSSSSGGFGRVAAAVGTGGRNGGASSSAGAGGSGGSAGRAFGGGGSAVLALLASLTISGGSGDSTPGAEGGPGAGDRDWWMAIPGAQALAGALSAVFGEGGVVVATGVFEAARTGATAVESALDVVPGVHVLTTAAGELGQTLGSTLLGGMVQGLGAMGQGLTAAMTGRGAAPGRVGARDAEEGAGAAAAAGAGAAEAGVVPVVADGPEGVLAWVDVEGHAAAVNAVAREAAALGAVPAPVGEAALFDTRSGLIALALAASAWPVWEAMRRGRRWASAETPSLQPRPGDEEDGR